MALHDRILQGGGGADVVSAILWPFEFSKELSSRRCAFFGRHHPGAPRAPRSGSRARRRFLSRAACERKRLGPRFSRVAAPARQRRFDCCCSAKKYHHCHRCCAAPTSARSSRRGLGLTLRRADQFNFRAAGAAPSALRRGYRAASAAPSALTLGAGPSVLRRGRRAARATPSALRRWSCAAGVEARAAPPVADRGRQLRQGSAGRMQARGRGQRRCGEGVAKGSSWTESVFFPLTRYESYSS